MGKNIRISGMGCSLADFLYLDIDFTSRDFSRFLSKTPGDGGLSPGKLVFADTFAKFAGRTIESVISEITGGREPDRFNIGGPGIVPLIHAAQMLCNQEVQIRFYGAAGTDKTGRKLTSSLRSSPIDIDNYKFYPGDSPFTYVLSDPNFDQGNGERIFINNIGVAGSIAAEAIDDEFFDSDITVFGGTALLPQIHDSLGSLLKRAKVNKCFTIVNTVFDFRNEFKSPGEKWPMGKDDSSYHDIDLLIMDRVESLRLSGMQTDQDAYNFFASTGVSGFIITNGASPVHFYSNGTAFLPAMDELPVSLIITALIKAGGYQGDTTGCGDNFAGGVIGALVMQMTENKNKPFDLAEACTWGIASGGLACLYAGGTYAEKEPGEKLKIVTDLLKEYRQQVAFNQ